MPRHFLSLADWPAEELWELIETAQALKRELQTRGRNPPALRGKTLALAFQKPSLRTRVSFEIGMRQLGGQALYLGPEEIGLGKREAAGDVARVLGGYVQGIMVRMSDHALLAQMAQASPVPVINGMTNYSHPCQAMADALTMYEAFGRLDGLRVTYLGDSDNDVTRSLLFAAARFGFQLQVSSPPGYTLDAESIAAARAEGSEEVFEFVEDPVEAVREADVIYTDTWIGMDVTTEARARQIFGRYQVNEALVARAPAHAIVMHCLPANRGQEITDAVADGPRSRVFQQAGNRLHAQKPILLKLLG